ncbi:MAG TPA: hypothetical protein VNI54_03450 [Thermoanaerobaculia bacterium]|nr:hypothetical protein [Thermoanaerobaculia bacterium]
MRIARFFSKYGLEMFLAVSGIWAITEKFQKLTPETASLTLFLAGIVFTIYKIRDSLTEMKTDTATTQKALQQLVQEVNVLQGDSYLRELVELGRTINNDEPHLLAGHNATRSVYDHAATLLKGLRHLHLRDSQEFVVREKYIINDLLHALIKALPAPSVWLGVTHLTHGWDKDDADPGFREFRDEMHQRIKRGELIVLRVYWVGGDDISDKLRDNLLEEAAAGVKVGILRGSDPPSDLTLIYSLKPGSVTFDETTARESLRRDGSPICAMAFRTRRKRSLDSLDVYAPGAPEFRELALQFDQAWRSREPFE